MQAQNERLIRAEATGDSLTFSSSTTSAGAYSIGSAQAINLVNGNVDSLIDLANTVELNLGGELTLSAIDISQTSSLAIGVALSGAINANGSLALSGGGASSINTINSEVNSSITTGSYRNTATDSTLTKATSLQAATQTLKNDGSSAQKRGIKSEVGAGSAAVALSTKDATAAAIGVSKATNQINWNKATQTGVSTKLDVANIKTEGGLALTSINGDKIDAKIAAVSIGIAASGSGGNAVAISAAVAEATNQIGTSTSAQIIGRDMVNSVLNAGSLKLVSLDTSEIEAGGGAGSVSFSFTGGNISAAPSIGLALASNTLSSSRTTSIAGFSNITTTTGDLSLNSSSELLDGNGNSLQSRRITSTAAAAAVSAAIGKQFSLGLAGGGAASYNTILGIQPPQSLALQLSAVEYSVLRPAHPEQSTQRSSRIQLP